MKNISEDLSPLRDQAGAEAMRIAVSALLTAALANAESEDEARAILSGAMCACAHLYWVMKPKELGIDDCTVAWATCGRSYFEQAIVGEHGPPAGNA